MVYRKRELLSKWRQRIGMGRRGGEEKDFKDRKGKGR